ncbi:reverse transcriptase domain-containing protein [Tanacetum coccineum]
MEKTTKRYRVNHRFSTSYHPQTSGQVENTNGALKRTLEKTVKDNPTIWSRKLDDALWAFRTAYKTPIGTTPYKLIYGKNYHSPFEIKHRAYWALKNCNPYLIVACEKRMFQLHELDELRRQAYENSRLYKARTKVWHDRKLKMRKEFKQRNKVLLFHSKYKFKQPKLKSRWLGPYVVKHQYPSGYVKLYGKDGKTFIVNGHRLKLYHEEDNDPREALTPSSPKNDLGKRGGSRRGGIVWTGSMGSIVASRKCVFYREFIDVLVGSSRLEMVLRATPKLDARALRFLVVGLVSLSRLISRSVVGYVGRVHSVSILSVGGIVYKGRIDLFGRQLLESMTI